MTDANDFSAWISFFEDHGHQTIALHGILNGKCKCQDGLTCKSPGKHPRTKYKRGHVGAPWKDGDNLGVATDSLIIIDVDYDDDLATNRLGLPNTFTVRTAKGRHHYYLAVPDLQVKSVAGVRPGIDVRSVGGLVVTPPSRTIDGGRYHRESGSQFAPMPPEFAATLPQRQERAVTPLVHGERVQTTPEVAMVALQDQLVRIMTAVEGTRNGTLFQVACTVSEYYAAGYFGADSFQILRGVAERTGLDLNEIDRVIQSAQTTVGIS